MGTSIPASTPNPPLLTVGEVADRLQVHPRSVRRWIADDRMPVVRLGRAVRIRTTDVDRIIAGGGLG
ncbi:helix-turn-helix domain-containing protein [Limobrevibacterium gyesilva]|uniref:helix-turn-helix domain-containing protein n=1 Tax=Limobrevibacterium gyesilva TaxID=2991712 RepID=UPI0038CFC991